MILCRHSHRRRLFTYIESERTASDEQNMLSDTVYLL